MAWTNPTAPSTGDVLTATKYANEVVNNTLMGHPVFTTEAARDAFITAPSEGQMAYLTAPTVPAAAGASTFVPTGIMTIYNGTSWVCVTDVSTSTAATGTLGVSGWTATLGGSPGTNPSVTLTTGTAALVSFGCTLANTAAATTQMDIAVSGATTLAAGSYVVSYQIAAGTVNSHNTLTTVVAVTGLTAGTNTFTLQYNNNAGTASYLNRRLSVRGLL